jgi:hypothetical protein
MEVSTPCAPSSNGVDCSCFVEASISIPSSMMGCVRYAAQNLRMKKVPTPSSVTRNAPRQVRSAATSAKDTGEF